ALGLRLPLASRLDVRGALFQVLHDEGALDDGRDVVGEELADVPVLQPERLRLPPAVRLQHGDATGLEIDGKDERRSRVRMRQEMLRESSPAVAGAHEDRLPVTRHPAYRSFAELHLRVARGRREAETGLAPDRLRLRLTEEER